MKFLTTLFLFILGFGLFALAQQEIFRPSEVSQAAFFDISPPLRDIPIIPSGKVDRSWKDGVVKNKLNMPEHRNLPLPEASDEDFRNAQTEQGSRESQLLLSFNGVGNVNYVQPPDTQGDIGPNHYMQMVNLSFAIWNRSGTLLYGPVNSKTLWNGFPGPWSSSNDGDPIVIYDDQADRWIASQFALPNYPNGPFYELIAVSQTGDPTGAWYRYAFTFTNMPDYPKLGVWNNGYYLSVNSFSAGNLNWAGTGVAALDRTKMLAGDPSASMIFFTTPSGGDPSAFLPADCDGTPAPAGSPALFGYVRDGNPDRFVLYSLQADWTTPANSTFSQLVTLPVQSFSSNISGIPQKNTSTTLMSVSDRLMYRLQYRNFGSYQSMVTNHSINVSGHAAVRWYEFRNTGSGWQIYQQGTYSPDATSRWMGSIAMNSYGDIALGYSASSSTLFPSIRYTGRRASDPLGEMTFAEQDIIAGGGSQTSSYQRWGDYSMMSVDPVADSVFWYTQEYYTATSDQNWKTRIGSFTFGQPLVALVSASPQTLCAGESSQLNVQVTGAGAGVVYAWSSVPVGFTSNLPNPVVTPLVTTEYSVMVTSGGNSTSSSITITVNPLPTIVAPNDVTICAGSDITLSSIPFNQDSILWETQGDGVFENPNAARSDYTPGPQDIEAGSVRLIVTAFSAFGCEAASDELLLTIQAPPSVLAGEALEICQNNPVQLAGSGSQYSSLLWTTAGNGSFSNPTVADAVYTPSATDIAQGSVLLTLTANGNAPCTGVSDNLTVTIYSPATILAGDDVVVCSGEPVVVNAIASNYTSVGWSSTGDGQFGDASALSTTYIPGSADMNAGQVELSIIANSNALCDPVSDNLMVVINQLSQVTASNDTTICKTSSILIKGTAMNSSSTIWSSSGNGIFDNPNSLNTRYLPGTQDTIQGSVMLTLTATNAFNCGEVHADQTIQFAACLGVDSPLKPTVKILPNPTTGKFSVEVAGIPVNLRFRLTLTDALGEQVIDNQYTNSHSQFKTILDLSSQPKGIYLLKLSVGTDVITTKIMLQ